LLISRSAGDDKFATFVIGLETQEFRIQEDLVRAKLAHYSKCNEGEESLRIELPNISMAMFGYIQSYLYSEKLYSEDMDNLIGLWEADHTLGIGGLGLSILNILSKRRGQLIPDTAFLEKVWKIISRYSSLRDHILSWISQDMESYESHDRLERTLPRSVLWSLALKGCHPTHRPPAPGQQTSSALTTRRGTPQKRKKLTEERTLRKRRKPTEEKLVEDAGYTSRDSTTGTWVAPVEFRIQQVKTGNLASNTNHTQYLSLSENRLDLHHEVLGRREGQTTLWSPYSLPGASGFNIKISSMAKIYSSKDSLKIIIIVKDDTVCVLFKRGSTRNRFINFCASQTLAIKFFIISW
jgi:hypothetical protein